MKTHLLSRSYRRGFTLIEIVLVMGLVISIVGVAVVAANAGDAEKKLRVASGKAEDLIREARRLSLLQQRTYVVEFTPGKGTLEPVGRGVGEGNQSVAQTNSGQRFSWEQEYEDAEVQRGFPEIRRTKTFEQDITVEIKRWGERNFSLIEDDDKHRLFFEPSGLVEPVALKMNRGEGHIMVEMSVLSGAVRYEEMYIPND